jgi:DNA repair exonuclease SbcCD nuclease subunit
MPLKIVHCADLHIGASSSHLPSDLAAQRSEELRAAFLNIINYCKEKSVDALLICGDLFDSPKPLKKDCDFVRNALSVLYPVPVFIICGNHDYMCTDSIFSRNNYFTENVHVFPCFEHSFELEEKNAVIYGKSYSSNVTEPAFKNCLFDESKINILCLHGDVIPSSDYNAISRSTLSNIPCSYAAFGHIHNGEIFDVGNVRCAYSGTAEGHSFGDDGHTGFIYAEITKDETSLTHVSLSKRHYHNISYDISGLSSEQIVNELKKLVCSSDLYRITLIGECIDEINLQFIKEALESDVFYVETADHSSPSYNFDDIEAEESLRGEFLRELRALSVSEEEFIRCGKAGLDALSGRIPVMGEDI